MNEEIETLRAEASIPDAAPSTPDAPASEPQTIAAAHLRPLCESVVRGFGVVICKRANVDALTDAEIARIGEALAGVASCYDLANLDPRTAAWLTLAVAVSSVAIPRLGTANDNTAAQGDASQS